MNMVSIKKGFSKKQLQIFEREKYLHYFIFYDMAEAMEYATKYALSYKS